MQTSKRNMLFPPDSPKFTSTRKQNDPAPFYKSIHLQRLKNIYINLLDFTNAFLSQVAILQFKNYWQSMMLQRAIFSELKPYQTKYPCIICMERAKAPIQCLRCQSLLCHAHLRRIDDRCPYCRLTPFAYQRNKFTEELVQLDRKKEEEYLIETSEFSCLVQGCGFRGKYHKMDLHRRRYHRGEELREILFPEQREHGRKMKAVMMLLARARERKEQQNRAAQLGLILLGRSKGRVGLVQLMEMIAHVDTCGHPKCKRAHVEPGICFIGTKEKQVSECPGAQRFLTFFEVAP